MKLFSLKIKPQGLIIKLGGVRRLIPNGYQKKVKRNYDFLLARLQEACKHRKIRVGFLVNEPAKWQYESLYRELDKSVEFEPVVLVSERLDIVRGRKTARFFSGAKECYSFFEARGLRVRQVYDRERNQFLKPCQWGVDIVFYSQPHEFTDEQMPIKASKSVLTCYVPYGLYLMENSAIHISGFHDAMWRVFTEDRDQAARIRETLNVDVSNRCYVGYTKLDEYFKHTESAERNGKKRVIYAPHHSFSDGGLACATFRENGMQILQLAQSCKDKVEWIFKPHPRFRAALIRHHVLSEREVDQYYKAWAELGSIYEGGAYMDMFINSDALITDCVSFLGEYLPSEHPVFHLISPRARFNAFAESFIKSYYQIHSPEELFDAFSRVLMKGQDDKKDERLAAKHLLMDEKETSAAKIIRELRRNITQVNKTRILTVGVYDYFHYGHVRLFQQARSAAPNPYLIVAVQDSEFIKKYKPEANVFYSTAIRQELVSALRCVDEVVTYQDVSQIVKDIDFDLLAVGEDQTHSGFSDAIRFCQEKGKRVVRLHRTPAISSTYIKNHLK